MSNLPQERIIEEVSWQATHGCDVIASKTLQPHNLSSPTINGVAGMGKTAVDGECDMNGNSQTIEGNLSTVLRLLLLVTFVALGAIVTSGLANLISDGWPIVLADICGGVWGLSIAALCQVGGAKHRKSNASIYRHHQIRGGPK
jgi:hypothetical protein